MGSTPLKQISKEIDIRWEDPVVPRYNGQRSQRAQCSPAPGIETEKHVLPSRTDRKHTITRRLFTGMARRKNSQRPVHEVSVPKFPVSHHSDDCHPHHAVQRLSQTHHHLLLYSDDICRGGSVMLLTGKVFNFVAIVGTLGLIGMLIKNGIVLMDEITLQINEGVEPITALIDSSQSRLRPVMMPR